MTATQRQPKPRTRAALSVSAVMPGRQLTRWPRVRYGSALWHSCTSKSLGLQSGVLAPAETRSKVRRQPRSRRQWLPGCSGQLHEQLLLFWCPKYVLWMLRQAPEARPSAQSNTRPRHWVRSSPCVTLRACACRPPAPRRPQTPASQGDRCSFTLSGLRQALLRTN